MVNTNRMINDNNMNHEPRIRLDADDYGETINISRDIIGLLKEGCLDGIAFWPT